MEQFPELRTERLLLRQFTDTDLLDVFAGLSDPEVIKYYGVSYDSIEATKTQMNFFTDLEKTRTGIWWAVCSPDNAEFYGAGGLNDLSEVHRKAEIGCWLLRANWGKGFMTEGMEAILQFAFEQMDLHRVEAVIETENNASKKAMHKLNFIHEGTMKDCEYKNGRFISLDMYATFNPGEK